MQVLPDMVPVCSWAWGAVLRPVVKCRETKVPSVLNPGNSTDE